MEKDTPHLWQDRHLWIMASGILMTLVVVAVITAFSEEARQALSPGWGPAMILAAATCFLLALSEPGKNSGRSVHATCKMMAVVLGFVGAFFIFISRIDFSLWVFAVVGFFAYVVIVETITHFVASAREWLGKRQIRPTLVHGPVCLWHDDAPAEESTNMCNFCRQWFGLEYEV